MDRELDYKPLGSNLPNKKMCWLRTEEMSTITFFVRHFRRDGEDEGTEQQVCF